MPKSGMQSSSEVSSPANRISSAELEDYGRNLLPNNLNSNMENGLLVFGLKQSTISHGFPLLSPGQRRNLENLEKVQTLHYKLCGTKK